MMPFAAQVTYYMMKGDMNDWQGNIKLSSHFLPSNANMLLSRKCACTPINLIICRENIHMLLWLASVYDKEISSIYTILKNNYTIINI